ncbi:hypothetical protein Hanom_Chr01g00042151 [Helianthus anomalus]
MQTNHHLQMNYLLVFQNRQQLQVHPKHIDRSSNRVNAQINIHCRHCCKTRSRRPCTPRAHTTR